MPYAISKTIINAPYARVAGLLIDKMEKPKKYVGGILYSTVLERGEGFIVREMFEPRPNAFTIREKIYHHDVAGGKEFVYTHMNNALYTGVFRNILTRVGDADMQVELAYVMDWTAHPGTEDKISAETAQRMTDSAVAHMKALAEHPPVVPDWVRTFYAAVDSLRSEAMRPLLAENCKFRIGSATEILGRDNVIASSSEVTKHFAAISHDFVSVHSIEGHTFVECWVDYRMLDGASYMLPFLTMFERSGEAITSIKIFGDMAPLHHGWPGAAGNAAH